MNVLLIVVLLIFIISAVVGMHRGFIKSVWPFLAMIITIMLLWILAPVIKNFLISHTRAEERIETKLFTQIRENVLPDTPLSEQMTDWKIPESLKEKLKGSVETKLQEAADTEIHTISRSLSETILTVMAFVGGFVVIYILLLVVGLLLRITAKLPVLKQTDKFLGLLAGLVMAYLMVNLLFLMITAMMHTDFGSKLMGMIAESPILSFLYRINILTLPMT